MNATHWSGPVVVYVALYPSSEIMLTAMPSLEQNTSMQYMSFVQPLPPPTAWWSQYSIPVCLPSAGCMTDPPAHSS